jgi:hypothetical protein
MDWREANHHRRFMAGGWLQRHARHLPRAHIGDKIRAGIALARLVDAAHDHLH